MGVGGVELDMSTTVAVYQPRYFPRLHYLARIRRADVFVLYDDVEFSRRSRQHRAPIDFQDRDWLTAPVIHDGGATSIEDARLDMSRPWITEHVETLRHKYGAIADGLDRYYRDLLPFVPSVDAARELARDRPRTLSNAARESLDTFTRADATVASLASQRRDLSANKERVGTEIAAARRRGDDSSAAGLIECARALSDRIEALRTPEQRQKTIRNQALVSLGEQLDTHEGIERLSIRSLWTLDGVDVPAVVGEPRLVELTIPLLLDLLERFEIDTPVVRSSELPVDHPGCASRYLARLTRAVDGDCYLSGRAGYERYVDDEPFDDEDVSIAIQDWEPDWPAGNACSLDPLFEATNPAQFAR